jgi:hypothetical protein
MHIDLNTPGSLSSALRSLPAESAQPYDFSEFERRNRVRARAARRRAHGGRLVLAAVALLALLLVSVRGFGPSAIPVPLVTTVPTSSQTAAAVRADAMEHWLATLPSEPGVVQVGTRAAVTGLEDRIAQVDDLLSAARVARPPPARLLALQQERSRLVGTLVQVRYAENLVDESR